MLADHGGALRLGEVLAAHGFARTASLAVGGHVSDTVRPWIAMLGADLVRAVALTALTIVAAGGPARYALLLPISIVVGAGEGIFLPAAYAIVPALLPGGVIVLADGLAVCVPLASAVLALAVAASLTQRVWREFGAVADPTPGAARPAA